MHSILPPSSASCWVECPGSVLLLLMAQSDSASPAGLEGDVVHYIGRQMITAAQSSGRSLDQMTWDTVINGVAVNKEMTDGALLYADHCVSLMRRVMVFGGDSLGVEQRVEIPNINPHCFGTPDFYLYDAKADTLHIIDLKYGYRIVEVFENWQLLCYASGVCDLLGIAPSKIRLTIVQPRAPHRDGPIRSWDVADLDPYIFRLKLSAESALGIGPMTNSGPHCRDCKVLTKCETARRAAFNAMDVIGGLHTVGGESWYELYLLERAAKIVEHRITALREEIKARLLKGERIERYMLQDTRSNKNWDIPHDQVLAIGESYGVDLSKPKTMTPTQAGAAGVPREIIDMFSSRKKTGVKLVFDDLKKARYVFGGKEK